MTVEPMTPRPILAEWRPDTPEQLPSFAAIIEEACERWPDVPAAWDGHTGLSYGQLGVASAAVAAGLQGVEPGPVAILTGPTVDSIVALAGVLRSGRPTVMLDRAMPLPRLDTILRLARPALLVADDSTLDDARALAGTTVALRTLAQLRATGGSFTSVDVDPGGTAAILFTSGSSGQPKGVIWSHRLLATEALTTGQRMGYREHDRVAMSLPLSFAAGLAIAAVAIRWGSTLLVQDPRTTGAAAFLDWVREERATILHTTPSMLRSLLGSVEESVHLPDLRVWTACGEALYDSDITQARRHLSKDSSFVQWLGSSEGCSLAFVSYSATDALPDGAIPCGTASHWRRFRIVGDDGRERAAGEPGDLLVTTPVLADGYLDDPHRSAEKFVRRDDGLWDLHTGDVGTLDEGGVLRLFGRREAAVKIRGYLVDPSEIEACLLASGRVAECVVMATEDKGATRLVAYFVPSRGSSAASVADLRKWVSSQLPLWMVPAHFVALRELPRNERGKVDRPALPAVPMRRIDPPRGPLETEIAAIWAEVLNVEEVGRNEDFLELGGDSLSVETMLAAVEQHTGVRLLTSDFIQATTLGALVDRILSSAAATPPRWPATRVTMREGVSGRTVYCVAGGGASALAFAPLAAKLDPSDSVVVFQGRGVERRAPAEWTFSGMARRRAGWIETPDDGPMIVVGHSFGGVLALEVARRLQAQGRDVVPFLIDPFFSRTRAGGPGSHGRMGRRRALLLPLTGLIPASAERVLGLTNAQSGLLMRHHSPQPFPGTAYGYRTADNEDGVEMWERLLPDGVVRDLPASHMSILQAPFVDVIVADIRQVLGERADSLS